MSGKGSSGTGQPGDVVVRKAEHGWVVGEENVSDLTSAMVLADLFAADQAEDDDTAVTEAVDENDVPGAARPSPPKPRLTDSGPQQRLPAVSGAGIAGAGISGAGISGTADEAGEAARLAVTVAQLEHALAARVRVEQAIGVLAERHRLRPREAFDLLRKASRARGARVTELAHDVVASTANPLLRLPDELSRATPEPRQRSRSLRRGSTRGGRHALLAAGGRPPCTSRARGRLRPPCPPCEGGAKNAPPSHGG